MRCVVKTAVLRIITIKGRHVVVTPGHLTLKLAIEVVPVNVLVARAVADVTKVVAIELETAVSGLGHILGIFLAHSQFALCAARIGHVDVHAVLMAVEGDHSQFGGVARKVYAWHIAVGVEREFECAGYTVLDVEGHHRHITVFGTGHRIFVVVGTGIFVILLTGGISALKLLNAVNGHLALVVAHPGKHLRVARKVERTGCGKLLLVHPVGQAIYHLVKFAVLRHLALGIAKEQLYKEQVVVAHKGYDIAIGREKGHLLRSAVRQGLILLVLHIIYVIFGSV